MREHQTEDVDIFREILHYPGLYLLLTCLLKPNQTAVLLHRVDPLRAPAPALLLRGQVWEVKTERVMRRAIALAILSATITNRSTGPSADLTA